MITREELVEDGWADDKDSLGNKRYKKTMGRATFYVSYKLMENIYIGVFVPQNLEQLWSMSMWSKVFDGNCPDMKTFHYILNLVNRWV